MTQLKPTAQHFTAMGFPTPEALAEDEAADKAASAVLRDIVTGISAAMHQKPSDRITSLRTIARRLREINQIGRAESLEFAANRIDHDPLDFDAVRMVKITIDDLTEAVSCLGSAHSMTADTPGAVIPLAPTKRPNEDYERSLADYLARREESKQFLHPIERL